METKTIRELQDPKYTLVDISQDVAPINDAFGADYGGFLAELLDGDYREVWGFHGNIPLLDKTAYRVQ